MILIILIFYSTVYSYQSNEFILGHRYIQSLAGPHIDETDKQPITPFTNRHANNTVNSEIASPQISAEYLSHILKNPEKQNTVFNFDKLNSIYIPSSNNIKSTLQIINAPGSIISNINFSNTTIELVNSPNSLIVNNRIHSLSYNSTVSAISIVNSSNTKIVNNTIENNIASDGEMTGIIVSDSSNVLIQNNTINNLTGEVNADFSSISLGILLSNSTFSNVTGNQITNIYGVSTAAIIVEKGGTNRISFNYISEIATFSTNRSESFGILLVETTSNVVEDNNLQNIFANNLKVRSFAFGISLTGVSSTSIKNNNISDVEAIADRPDSFGIHLASSEYIQVKGNYIEQIFSQSDIVGRAFSTGIYMSHSIKLNITLNEITTIIAEGRASYGIYADNSNLLEISDNLIYDLLSISRYQNTADGIIIRIVNNTVIIRNNISQIESLTINIDSNLAIPSAVGILMDNIINATIEGNFIEYIRSTGNTMPTDSIGVLVSVNRHVNIQFNTIRDIYSSKYDSFSIGLTAHGSFELNINNNKIDRIQSESNSIVMYQAFSRQVLIVNNTIDIIGNGEKINGIYSVKNFNETVLNNFITSNHQTLGVPAILISFNELFTVSNNNLNDLVNNSIGISVKSGTNGNIRNNQLTNFLLWMQMTEDSILVTCDGNRVDNTVHGGCIIGEFHELVQLEAYLQNNFITNTINTNNEFQPDTQTGNNGSPLIFLIILPIILAAASSVIVKRKQIQILLKEIK